MRIYTLDPQLTEEQVAVTLAMTSRSPRPFDQIAQEVSADRAAEFHEKWVRDYGHASVAEHSVLHLAVEGISRLSCDAIEESRLASYTEKSSRYQVIGTNDYHVPRELDGHPDLTGRYLNLMNHLFSRYTNAVVELRYRLASDHPETSAGDIRRAVTDQARALLPAATLTQVGVTVNVREMAHIVRKLLSDPLAEIKKTGKQLKVASLAQAPTLLKYADAHPTLEFLRDDERWGRLIPSEHPHASATLLDYDLNALSRVAAGLGLNWYADGARAYRTFDTQEPSIMEGVITQYLPPRQSEHDPLPRAFELVNYLFALTMDYGALREFRRHRMLTPISQRLLTTHGYQVPPLFETYGMADAFHAAMAEADEVHGLLEEEFGGAVAQYVVTHAHQQQILVQTNLRELTELFRLRTSARAHASIRAPALAMREEVRRVHPFLMDYIESTEEEAP